MIIEYVEIFLSESPPPTTAHWEGVLPYPAPQSAVFRKKGVLNLYRIERARVNTIAVDGLSSLNACIGRVNLFTSTLVVNGGRYSVTYGIFFMWKGYRVWKQNQRRIHALSNHASIVTNQNLQNHLSQKLCK